MKDYGNHGMKASKKASGTHKSMGKKGYAEAGLESGIAETQKVGMTSPGEVGNTGRVKAQKHGSIAKK